MTSETIKPYRMTTGEWAGVITRNGKDRPLVIGGVYFWASRQDVVNAIKGAYCNV